MSMVPKFKLMENKDLEIKSPVDVSEIETQYNQYISMDKNAKPNNLLLALALLVLFSGGFVTYDISKETECIAEDDDFSNWFGCTGVFLNWWIYVLTPTLILFSIPLIMRDRQLNKKRYAIMHKLEILAKLSHYPSDLAGAPQEWIEERVLSHVRSVLNQRKKYV